MDNCQGLKTIPSEILTIMARERIVTNKTDSSDKAWHCFIYAFVGLLYFLLLLLLMMSDHSNGTVGNG